MIDNAQELRNFIAQELVAGPLAVLLRQLQTGVVPTFTTATLPTPDQPTVVFVSDGGAGSKFQGWDGSSWVSLG